MDFSDPEPEFEYFFKPKTIETDTFLRICTEKPEILIKEIESQSHDNVGISLFPNFSNFSAKFGRVQVPKHNLKIKRIWVYLTLITLNFSGIRATEFKQSIEKRWDERNKTSTPDQTWLIPQPTSSSWGDSNDYNKVNLVKNIIGYKPRINTKNDKKNMRSYLEKSSKSELVIPKGGTNERYLPMGAPLLDFLAVETEGLAGWKYPSLKNLKE